VVDLTRVLVGLDEYLVVDAVERHGELVVTVRVGRAEAPCPVFGVLGCSGQAATRGSAPGMGACKRARLTVGGVLRSIDGSGAC
jgi:hypothetical protein